jgi:hypothetical protein
MVTEVRLLRLIEDALLPLKEVIGWRAIIGKVVPNP